MLASHKKLDNFTVLVDNNKMQIDGLTKDVCNVESVADKWRAFGYEVFEVNGHDEQQIDDALCQAKKVVGKPTCIVLDTIKGHGVKMFEDMGPDCHSCNVSAEQLEKSLKELEG